MGEELKALESLFHEMFSRHWIPKTLFFVVTFVEFYCYTVKYIFETRKDRAMFLWLCGFRDANEG